MAGGFSVQERIDRPVAEVWAFLTDMTKAPEWMTGVQAMEPVGTEPIGVGSRFRFMSRGAPRETAVTAWQPMTTFALTSIQGGVTATYEYRVKEADGATEVELHALCEAKGFWKLLHPLIATLMKKSDSKHLLQLKKAIEGH